MNKSTFKKYSEINFIKGIAIIWIVIFHLYKDFPQYFAPGENGAGISLVNLIMWGPMGVNLFVICSGFLLSLSAYGKNETVLSFYYSRLKRLLPLYYAAIVFVLAADYAFGKENFSLNFLSLLQHIFLIHGFTDNLFDIQGAWWYMGMIVQLYLLFPILNKLIDKIPVYLGVTAGIVLTITARYIPFANIDSNYSVFTFLPDFIVGMYLFRYDFLSKMHAFFLPLILFCTCALGLFFYCMAYDISIFAYWNGTARAIVSMGIFFMLLLCYNYIIKPLPYTGLPILLFGSYSYAIYLFHRPVIYKFITTLSEDVHRLTTLGLFMLCIFLFGFAATKTEKFFFLFVRRHYERFSANSL